MYATVVFLLTLPLLGHDSWAVREDALDAARSFAGRGEGHWLLVRNLAHGPEVTDPEVRYRLRLAYQRHTLKVIDSLLPADAVMWPDIDRLADLTRPATNDPDELEQWKEHLDDLRTRYVIRKPGPRDWMNLYLDYRAGMRAWAVDQLGNCTEVAHLDTLRAKIASVVALDKRRDPSNTEPKDTKEYKEMLAFLAEHHPGILNPRYKP